jgi:hypothetical protein
VNTAGQAQGADHGQPANQLGFIDASAVHPSSSFIVINVLYSHANGGRQAARRVFSVL